MKTINTTEKEFARINALIKKSELQERNGVN